MMMLTAAKTSSDCFATVLYCNDVRSDNVPDVC